MIINSNWEEKSANIEHFKALPLGSSLQKQQTPNRSLEFISYRHKVNFVDLILIVFWIGKALTIFINQDKVYLGYTFFVQYIFMLYQSLINANMSHSHFIKSFFVNFKDGSITGSYRFEAKETLLSA